MPAKPVKISPVHAGLFKLDGGAMFGVVPKKLWEKLIPADDKNMCTWAMRCLLIEYDDQKILVDTGIGEKQDEKFRSHFSPHGKMSLEGSLRDQLIDPKEITDVFLTHLHFDHCGGAVMKTSDGKLVPSFENATYWSNDVHYNWALDPNPREKASFLKENFIPLKDAGVLKLIDVPKGGFPNWISSPWGDCVRIAFAYGHTEAMMVLKIKANGKIFLYCADLLPSHAHIGMPYVMGYDIRPLVTLEEKKKLYAEALDQNLTLIFEHDAKYEACTLKKNERGRVVIDEFCSI